MEDFSHLLQATLTPVALISGVGLLLLSMTNRYNHALDRIRHLLKEKQAQPMADWRKVDLSIGIIYGRCKIMRKAILCVSSSIVSSGAMIFATALEGLGGLELGWLKALLLMVSIGLVVVASILFVIEVGYSLRAITLEIEPGLPANTTRGTE
ncbi:MAG: DUF2721 domain-containing protein [Candidatus Delongbacteria bacterium]